MTDVNTETEGALAVAIPVILETPAPAADAPEPVKPVAAKPAAKKPAAKVESEYPRFLKSTTNFPYVDPDTGIRFAPGNPIKVDVEPKAGSWLDSQIKAGYIGKA